MYVRLSVLVLVIGRLSELPFCKTIRLNEVPSITNIRLYVLFYIKQNIKSYMFVIQETSFNLYIYIIGRANSESYMYIIGKGNYLQIFYYTSKEVFL